MSEASASILFLSGWLVGAVTVALARWLFPSTVEIETRAERLLDGERFGGES